MNQEIKNRIEELKKEIDTYRPLSKDMEGRIMQKFRLDWNFHSNNIEGNQLTFGETKTFLLHGITADKKPLKDHLDIKGHNEALKLLDEVVKKDYPITENFIREMHEIILHEPYENPAISPDGKKVTRKISIGQYKSQANHVITATGETFYFASPEETPAKMHDLIKWYRKEEEKQELHPLELAAQFHYSFIRIHPFDDGNGRMARILMNLILMRSGFPPVVVKTQDRDNYFKALQGADGGDVGVFEDYIAGNLVDSLDLFLRGAKGEDISELADLDKELALLKKEVKTIESSEVLRISKKLIIARYYDSYKSLLALSMQKLNGIKDLFTSSKSNVIFNNTIVGYNRLEVIDERINEYIKYQQELKEESNFRHSSKLLSLAMEDKHRLSWTNMRLEYVFSGYKHNETNAFDIKSSVMIYFEEFKFIIYDDDFEILTEGLYSNVISPNEIKNIVYLVYSKTINNIKSQIKQK